MAYSQNTELQETRSSKSSLGYFKEKEFLSVDEIYDCLKKKSIYKIGKKMSFNIEQTRSDMFLHLPVEFSITGLQHCTDRDSTRKILETQSFIGTTQGRLSFTSLSFWAVDVPSSDIEKARQEAYTHVQETVRKCETEEYLKELMQQFANSPAFNKSASRYGNFRFSFQFSDLLSLYEAQFCEGKKPELSILGTDVYKQEVVHYVVVHSPNNTRFKDHPRVPRLQTRCDPLPSIFLLGDTLYWRPESTSESLEVDSSHGDQSDRRVDNVEERRERAPNTGNKEVTVTQMDTSTQQPCPLSTHVRVKQQKTGGSGTVKHAADKESKRGGPHQQRSLRTDYSKISSFFRPRPTVLAEEVEVREQPSTYVLVNQERTGGFVTGKHAAERGDPHELGESVEQCGPPLKKKK